MTLKMKLIEESQNNIHLKNGTAKSYASMISNTINNHPAVLACGGMLFVSQMMG